MKLTKTRLAYAAGLVFSCSAAGGYWYYTQNVNIASNHGHGKKALSCDMSVLTIRHNGLDKAIRVNDYVNLNAEGLVHELARKMKYSKVKPMSQVIDEYPAISSVTFIPCDSEDSLVVPLATIQNDPLNYILSLNNRGRVRLTTYTLTNKRAKYRTKVKNVTRIEIN